MISDSIIQTFKYSDHFGFPLTFDEVSLRLIKISLPKPKLKVELAKLIKSKLIDQTGDYYHLPRRSKLVSSRIKNLQTSLPIQERAKTLAGKLSKVPGVLAIYLTGSLSMSNSTGDSDIDLMIITQNNRLWTTRFFLTIYVSLLGLRRTPGSNKNSGKICLNLYLTPSSYLLPADRRSLYTAYELIQAIPLYDPNGTRSELLLANSWLRSYLPNAPTGSDLEGRAQPADSKAGRSDPLGTLIEFLLYHLQLLYMKSKITREYISSGAAFFHPNDPGSKVLKKLSL